MCALWIELDVGWSLHTGVFTLESNEQLGGFGDGVLKAFKLGGPIRFSERLDSVQELGAVSSSDSGVIASAGVYNLLTPLFIG